MTTDNSTKPVTIAECVRKHRVTKWGVSIILATMALLVVLVGWAIIAGGNAKDAAGCATNAAGDVHDALDVHQARQNGTLERIDDRLDAIRDTQAEVKEDIEYQRRMLEDIWKKEHAPE